MKKLSLLEISGKKSHVIFYDYEFQHGEGDDRISLLIEKNKSFFDKRRFKLHPSNSLNHFQGLANAGKAVIYTNIDAFIGTYGLEK